MEALTELTDLISNNPKQFSQSLFWICGRCPTSDSLLSASPRVSRSQLNAILALARFLSNSSNFDDFRPKSAILEFIRSISSSFVLSFWPQSFGIDAISTFFCEFLGYISKATDLSPDFATDVAGFSGDVVLCALNPSGCDSAIANLFLTAFSYNSIPILPADANRCISIILHRFTISSPLELTNPVPDSSSSQSSPNSSLYFRLNDSSSPVNELSLISGYSSGVASQIADDATSSSLIVPAGYPWRRSSDMWIANSTTMKHQIALLEEESLETLEVQEMAFRLMGQIVEKVNIDSKLSEQLRIISKKQLQNLSFFLKIRKRDWTDQGSSFKIRIQRKLSVYQSVANFKVKSMAALNPDGKSQKRFFLETLALLIDAVEACLHSVWRKLRACEELFSCMLVGITEIAITRGDQILRVLLIRLKPLVLVACAQSDVWGSSNGAMFDSVLKACCEIVKYGWEIDRGPVDTFVMGLAASIRENIDYEEEEDMKEKPAVPVLQLNVVRMLAELNVYIKKPEAVDMILPIFIQTLDEGDSSTSNMLRLRILDAMSRMAGLGFEKSYRETVVLMIRSYLCKLSSLPTSAADNITSNSDTDTECAEVLPAGFLSIAATLTDPKLRSDFRHRLLSLCSDVGLASESNNGRSGGDFLGPLLPAVAEMCSDFDPIENQEPSLLKLFRNLWFYIALFSLAPSIHNSHAVLTTLSSVSVSNHTAVSSTSLNSVSAAYNPQWRTAVHTISRGTPPLVVSSVKWLEDELELNTLHTPGSRRGNGNEKAALSAALAGRVDVPSMGTISPVKATYLLSVATLEILRFSSNGGILNGDSARSSFCCVFEYLKTPSLSPPVSQCLTAVLHRSFETAVSWLEDGMCGMGPEMAKREETLSAHACFFIRNMSQREENVRDLSVSLLTQLRERFPQILWSSPCIDSLLSDPDSASFASDPSWASSVRNLYQRVVREWLISAVSSAPCTAQGLLQEKLCKVNVVSLLSEIRFGNGRSDCWSGIRTANIPAVTAAATAASGSNHQKSVEAVMLEVISTGMVSATVKCNHAGEISGMRRLYNSIGGFAPTLVSGTDTDSSFNEILVSKFIHLLQQFVTFDEKGLGTEKISFRETCSQATALLLSSIGPNPSPNQNPNLKSNPDVCGSSQLLRLLCWCPAYVFTPEAMETGVFVWSWLVSAAPELGPVVLAELVDAWLWTVDMKRGIFASDPECAGPVAKLRPHLAPGEAVKASENDPTDQIVTHGLWVGFLMDRFEVAKHNSVEQLLLFGRLLQGTLRVPWSFSCHPAVTGTFFTFMLLGLKFCACHQHRVLAEYRAGLQLLEEQVFRACLLWFGHLPEWYEMKGKLSAQNEALSVSIFVQFLLAERAGDGLSAEGRGKGGGTSPFHGAVDNTRERRKHLLLLLCQHEVERLEVWSQPTNPREGVSMRPKTTSEKWMEYVKTAFSVDPRIAFALSVRFPVNPTLKSELTELVHTHLWEVCQIPESLPYLVSTKAAEDDSPFLQHLPHWAPCSITQALEFLTPAYKSHPRIMSYVLRVLDTYPPEHVTFFMPQLVQSLRHDHLHLVQNYLLRAAHTSHVFAHILIWNLQSEETPPEPPVKPTSSSFQSLLPNLRQTLIDRFTPHALDLFDREFRFFDRVTSISGTLLPLPKDERRAGIKRELETIPLEGDDLYLPTAPGKLVRGIQLDSGVPLQSAAKVPIMITFDVVDRDGDPSTVTPQACIFKVGDDCRQDVLALQVISLLRDIFSASGLKLYVYPYGVLPTGHERGIIEVVPDSRSRSQMGETTDGGLYEIFQQEFGPVGSAGFEAARDEFIVSSAGYAVASLLLQPKDRHNGNLLIDRAGRLVHIDFGFILETSPGGNMRFESAHFKLSHEMTQLLDPSGAMKSDTWQEFVGLCVKGYLVARERMEEIVTVVMMMVESGLPCFSRGDPIGNLRKRFHQEMTEREAANFMIRICADAYNKWTTAGYDLIQYLQQGIEK